MKIVISEPGYKEIDPLEIDLGCRDVTLIGVYNGIGIETDQGCFGICQRDGGIEIMLEGKLVWSSMDHLELEHQVDAGAGNPHDLEDQVDAGAGAEESLGANSRSDIDEVIERWKKMRKRKRMNKRLTKRWVCFHCSEVLQTAFAEGWPFNYRPGEDIWSPDDEKQISAAIEEIISELQRRGLKEEDQVDAGALAEGEDEQC